MKAFKNTFTIAFLAIGIMLAGSKKDIVTVASEAGSFQTLIAAAKAAGLVETLQSPGPLTVLAPTDEAFAKLPKGTVENLLKPENKKQLAAILTYHVIAGKVPAEKIVTTKFPATVNGQRLAIKAKDGKVLVNQSNVIKTDIMASNGIIHVIDQVLIPADKNIAEVAMANGNFTTLLTALKATGLDKALVGEGPFTVFAPTDAAFAKLPKGTLDNLLKPENKDQLAGILKYHVVAGIKYSPDVLAVKKVNTLNGLSVRFSLENGKAMVNQSNLVMTDITTSNGVIHVIDAVLLPPAGKASVRKAEALIKMAIERGAPLYNHGNAMACASIYEMAGQALISMSDQLPAESTAPIRMAMQQLRDDHSWSDKAWTLRRGLDKTYMALAEM
jgi:transforming growth factor-beta-induced protein